MSEFSGNQAVISPRFNEQSSTVKIKVLHKVLHILFQKLILCAVISSTEMIGFLFQETFTLKRFVVARSDINQNEIN